MGKRRGQIQMAVDQLNAEIVDLERVRDRLIAAALRVNPKRKPKAAKPRMVPDDKAS